MSTKPHHQIGTDPREGTRILLPPVIPRGATPTSYIPVLPSILSLYEGMTPKECSIAEGKHRIDGTLHLKWLHDTAIVNDWGNYETYTFTTVGGRVGTTALFSITDLRDVARIQKLEPLKTPGYEFSFMGQGVLSQTNYDEWHFQRDKLKPVFSLKALQRLVPIMQAGAERLCHSLRALNGQTTPVHDLVHENAFENIGHVALGEESGFLRERCEPLRAAYDFAFTASRRDPEVRMVHQRTIEDFSADVFDRAASKECPMGGDSLVGVLSGEDPSRIHPEDNLHTFIFAGHETVSRTTCFLLYELSRHPEVQEAVRAEINEKWKADLQYRDMNMFRKLTKCINETLRLWPAVATGSFRQLQQDEQVHVHPDSDEQVILRKGSFVCFPHIIIHTNPRYWGADASQWKPFRKWNPKAFLPFALPPRGCLGLNVAMLEMRAFLIAILREFTILPPDAEVPRERGKLEATLRSSTGIPLRFVSRRANPKL